MPRMRTSSWSPGRSAPVACAGGACDEPLPLPSPLPSGSDGQASSDEGSESVGSWLGPEQAAGCGSSWGCNRGRRTSAGASAR